MERLFKYFVLLCICSFIFKGAVTAQQINSVADEFYNGLADVIEKNMDAPEDCVREVDNYFAANQDKVELIRHEGAMAMEQIAPEIDKYMSMTEEEAAAMAQKQGTQANSPAPKMSAAGQRYNEVFKVFCSRHPQQGMKIAGKTMQLVPGFSITPTQRKPGSDYE